VEAQVNEEMDPVIIFGVNLALLSLITFGGVNPILPELHRQIVEVYGWMTSERFVALYAVAQAAPGPNILFVTLIGWQVGGLLGALVATAALCVPTCTIIYFVAGLWERFRFAKWRIVVQNGLIPVTIGLVAATAYVLAKAADQTLPAVLLTLATAVAVTMTKLHPLLFLAAGAVLGAVGLI
jgi:chromate transporter